MPEHVVYKRKLYKVLRGLHHNVKVDEALVAETPPPTMPRSITLTEYLSDNVTCCTCGDCWQSGRIIHFRNTTTTLLWSISGFVHESLRIQIEAPALTNCCIDPRFVQVELNEVELGNNDFDLTQKAIGQLQAIVDVLTNGDGEGRSRGVCDVMEDVSAPADAGSGAVDGTSDTDYDDDDAVDDEYGFSAGILAVYARRY